MKNRGTSIVELVLAVGILAIIGVASVSWLVQTVTAENEVIATTQATQNAQFILERVEAAVKKSSQVRITNSGTKLEAIGVDCEVFSISDERIYLDVGQPGGACPASSTNLPLSESSAKITNGTSPVMKLFTGNPVDDNALSVTMKLRVRVDRPFASSEIVQQHSVTRRR